MPLNRPGVVLIGRRLEHNENLGLSYLCGALDAAGIDSRRYYVNDARELADACAAVLAAPPEVLGLSLADGGSSILPLALGEALARAGFRGHVTAGGQFATLARSWLLERHSWLDSVVRFAGERALVDIVERVRSGRAVSGVPGVTTREGDGATSDVGTSSFDSVRPLRDELPDILGYKAAHVNATRGCLGRCHYCGPAALHEMELAEGVRAGHDRSLLRQAGVGGVRVRPVEDVAREMARLWHDERVRYFYFVDEHLLPYAEADALDFLACFRRALERERVGPFGIGTMLRADRVTPAIARAFAELGLVRVFVGLELASAEEGRRFGRRAPGPRELDLLETFAELGVVTVSNLMLLHPYSSPASIARGIDLLESVPRGVFEATRMMVYHGTRLHESMRSEGRLLGNPFRYGYRFEDPCVERFAQIFARLRAEAFWNYSVAFRTHDAFLAAALDRRLTGGSGGVDLTRKIERVRIDVNRLYVGAFRRALALAEAGAGFDAASPLIAELIPRVRAIEAELAGIEAELAGDGARRGRGFSPMKAAAASVLSFVLVSSCAREQSGPPAAGPTDAVDAGTVSAESPDAGSLELVDSALAPGELGPATEAETGRVCGSNEREALLAEAKEIVQRADACFSGEVRLGSPPTAFVESSVRSSARLCAVRSRDDVGRVELALAQKAAACTESDGRPLKLEVAGGSQRDMLNAISAVEKCSRGGVTPGVRVVLDGQGRVLRVQGGIPQHARCIESVLKGLRFPCLTGFEVCPEHVIIE